MKSWTSDANAGTDMATEISLLRFMTKSAALFPVVLLGLSTLACAQGEAPRLGDTPRLGDSPRSLESAPVYIERGWFGGRVDLPTSSTTPVYYRPTQRYYGPGYTISYRYVPVYKSDGPGSVVLNGASNFRTESFHIATDDIPSWGANPPRLMVKDPKSGAPRTAVTSIVRKKTTTTTKSTGKPDSATDVPAVTPSATGSQGPVATPAPAGPAPIPPPADAPKQ